MLGANRENKGVRRNRSRIKGRVAAYHGNCEKLLSWKGDYQEPENVGTLLSRKDERCVGAASESRDTVLGSSGYFREREREESGTEIVKSEELKRSWLKKDSLMTTLKKYKVLAVTLENRLEE